MAALQSREVMAWDLATAPQPTTTKPVGTPIEPRSDISGDTLTALSKLSESLISTQNATLRNQKVKSDSRTKT